MVAPPSGWVYSYANPSVLQNQGHGWAGTEWKIPNIYGQAKIEILQRNINCMCISFSINVITENV